MFISENKPQNLSNLFQHCLFFVTSVFSTGPAKVTVKVENGIIKQKCPKCQEEFLTQDALKFHMTVSKAVLEHTQQVGKISKQIIKLN